jgi:hypothetical protein
MSAPKHDWNLSKFAATHFRLSPNIPDAFHIANEKLDSVLKTIPHLFCSMTDEYSHNEYSFRRITADSFVDSRFVVHRAFTSNESVVVEFIRGRGDSHQAGVVYDKVRRAFADYVHPEDAAPKSSEFGFGATEFGLSTDDYDDGQLSPGARLGDLAQFLQDDEDDSAAARHFKMHCIDLVYVIGVLTGREFGSVQDAIGIASSLSASSGDSVLFVSSVAALTALPSKNDLAVPDRLPDDSVLAVIVEIFRKTNCTPEYVRDNYRHQGFSPFVYQQLMMFKRLIADPLTAPLVPADMVAIVEAMA